MTGFSHFAWKNTCTCLTALILLAFARFSFAQTNTKSSTKQETIEKVTIDNLLINADRRGLPWQLWVDLGVLNANQKYKFELVFSTNKDFSYEGIRPSCACHKFSLADKIIEQGKESSAILEIKGLGGTSNGKSGLTATFHKAGREVGMFVFDYKIAGSLHVDQVIELNVAEGISEHRIPISFTSPISMDSLEISGQDSFKGAEVQTSLASSGDNHYIELLVNSEIEGGFTSGELVLRDRKTNHSVRTAIILSKSKSVVVSPSLIWFSNEKKQYRASVLVKLDKKTFANEVKREGKSIFKISRNQSTVAHKSSYLGGGVYRVNLSLTKPAQVSSENENLIWVVSDGTTSESFITPFQFGGNQ